MVAVVTDTGPPHYLLLIGEIALLPRLFGQLFMPGAVHAELSHPRAPSLVRDWITSGPSWLQVIATPPVETLPFPSLDDGERAAIALAEERRANLILMDDRAGVMVARGRGFAVVGTLGVLDLAARRGLVDPPLALARLKATNFRVRAEVIDAVVARYRGEG